MAISSKIGKRLCPTHSDFKHFLCSDLAELRPRYTRAQFLIDIRNKQIKCPMTEFQSAVVRMRFGCLSHSVAVRNTLAIDIQAVSRPQMPTRDH